MRSKLWERMLSGRPIAACMDRKTTHRRPSRFEESQLQGVGQKPSDNKKAAEISGFFVILGGGTVRYFNFPHHLSKSMNINKIISLNCHYVHRSLW